MESTETRVSSHTSFLWAKRNIPTWVSKAQRIENVPWYHERPPTKIAKLQLTSRSSCVYHATGVDV